LHNVKFDLIVKLKKERKDETMWRLGFWLYFR